MTIFNQDALLDWGPVMAAVQAKLVESLAYQSR